MFKHYCVYVGRLETDISSLLLPTFMLIISVHILCSHLMLIINYFSNIHSFRRGEPELAARVRYDHPTQLSGAAMQLNKAKLEALGATGSGPTAYHPGQFEASANTSIQQQLGSIPNEDRAGLLMRQMGMLNGGAMGSSMQQSQGAQHNMQAIYRMMQQNAIAQQQQQQQQQQTASATSDGNSNSNMSLQMAMAQEMMQQRQQQQQQISPHGQQQLAMLLQNQVAAAQQGMPNQVSLPSFASFQQGMGDGVGTESGGSLSNNQTGPSAGSLTTLTGGGNPNMTANGTPQLNFNSPYGMLGGGASNNPAAMNAFLAQYAQQGGVVPAIPPPTKEAAPAPTDGGGGNDKDGDASV